MNNNGIPAPVNPAYITNHVVTGIVRLSYCHLIDPYAQKPGDTPKYSTTILLPKTDILTKQKIDAAIAAATAAGVEKKWNGQKPPIIPIPIHDGDGTRPSDGMPFGEECRGCWVMTASNTNKPRIVDLQQQDIIDPAEIYSGMYARVSVDFFPYFAANKKGIGCSLVNIQKLQDGEPLAGSRATVAADFGDGYVAPAVPGAVTSAPNAGKRYNPITGLYE